MDYVRVLAEVGKPLLQFGFAPLFSGIVVAVFNNRKSNKENKTKLGIQKNENIVALEKLIKYAEEINEKQLYIEGLRQDILKAEEGDFSILKEEEYRSIKENEFIEAWRDMIAESNHSINMVRVKMNETFEKFKYIPKDLLGDEIHLEILRYISSDELKHEINIDNYKKTLHKVKNLK